jgi:signal transduction histidine kinase
MLSLGMKAWRRITAVILAAAAAARPPAQSRPMAIGVPTPHRAWLRRALHAAAALLFGLGQPAMAQAADAPVLRITEALAIDSDAPQFPADRQGTVRLLPDLWGDIPAEGPVHRWYRVRFDRPAPPSPDTLLALAIERVCSAVELRLNGEPLHHAGGRDAAAANQCHRPQLIGLPGAALRPRDNLLELRVGGRPLRRVASREQAAGLSAIEIGPHERLAPIHATRWWWNVGAVAAVNLVLATLAVLLLALAWLRRRDAAPFYLGSAALLWAALSARVWAGGSLLPDAAVEFLAVPMFALATALAVQFLLSYAGLRSRAIEGALAAQCVVVPLSQWIAGPNLLFPLAGTWSLLLVGELAAAVALYVHTSARQRRRDFRGMALVLGAVLALLALEVAVGHDLLPAPPVSLLHLLLPLTLIALLLRLMWAFVNALHAAEADRTALEARVREAAGEIERKYLQLAELRVEQVTQRERKRIAADLHDDLGAKLLTIVHTSDSDRISTLAREALEEMRLSVRGLTGKPMRLSDALADWRAETVSRLGQANVEIDWRGPAEETDVELPARSFVQTTRILREAVSNIIKHSGASHCKVRCAITADAFGLNIQDNGKGIPMELDGKLDRGHGMSSMKHRAKQMQGQCLVESGPGYGTVIRLTLPLDRATQPAP